MIDGMNDSPAKIFKFLLLMIFKRQWYIIKYFTKIAKTTKYIKNVRIYEKKDSAQIIEQSPFINNHQK